MPKFLTSILDRDVRVTACARSWRIACGDWHFFHPEKMVKVSDCIEIVYTDEWIFRLVKSEKVDGEWVDIETKEVKGSDIECYIGAISLMHIPPTLEPLDDVEVPTELLDE